MITSYQVAILRALQHRPIYLGTANSVQVAKNRAANKVARRQRKVNRRLDKSL